MTVLSTSKVIDRQQCCVAADTSLGVEMSRDTDSHFPTGKGSQMILLQIIRSDSN